MSLMETLPSLDAHAHIAANRTADELVDAGAVLAMTGSLDEAALVTDRREPYIAWGVGCHPRSLKAQESFDVDLFRELAERTAIVGEIGLDGRSRRVPFETQLRTFRQALEALSDLPRMISIHPDGATEQVIEELRRKPVAVPVLHGWRGPVKETREAVALGCYFSVLAVLLDTPSFTRQFHLSVCSSKPIITVALCPPLFRVGSSGWSTYLPNPKC